jgi:hypothetical protein
MDVTAITNGCDGHVVSVRPLALNSGSDHRDLPITRSPDSLVAQEFPFGGVELGLRERSAVAKVGQLV